MIRDVTASGMGEVLAVAVAAVAITARGRLAAAWAGVRGRIRLWPNRCERCGRRGAWQRPLVMFRAHDGQWHGGQWPTLCGRCQSGARPLRPRKRSRRSPRGE